MTLLVMEENNVTLIAYSAYAIFGNIFNIICIIMTFYGFNVFCKVFFDGCFEMFRQHKSTYHVKHYYDGMVIEEAYCENLEEVEKGDDESYFTVLDRNTSTMYTSIHHLPNNFDEESYLPIIVSAILKYENTSYTIPLKGNINWFVEGNVILHHNYLRAYMKVNHRKDVYSDYVVSCIDKNVKFFDITPNQSIKVVDNSYRIINTPCYA